jgi:tetratricopeptide (TPR) repeat protein
VSQAELNRAWELIRSGRPQEARSLLAAVVAQQPRLAEAHRLLGMACRMMGVSADAEAAFRAAIAADKKNPAHAAEFAAFLEAEGRTKEAERQFRAALALNRRFAPAVSGLAHLLLDQGRAVEALQATTPLVADARSGGSLRLLHARAQQEAGRLDAAEDTLEAAIVASPTDANAHSALAELRWMRTGERDAATEALDRALAAAPLAAGLRLVRARVLTQTGDADAARAEIEEALKAAPDDPALRLAKAKLSGAEGLAYAEDALKTRPDDLDLLVLAAQAALAGGNAAAARYAERLVAAAPLNQFYIALQATAWRILGDPRYAELYDYERTVHTAELGTPKGWSTLSSYLADLAVGLHGMHALKAHPFGQSVRGGSQVIILSAKNPAVAAVQEALAPAIPEILARLSSNGHPLGARNTGRWRYTGMWSIRLASSGYHDNHVHPEGWLSSACYVEVPPLEGQQGWLKFGEPGVKTRDPMPPEAFAEPKPGRLVLFPSYMWHGVVPFTADRPRLNFAFDLVPA